MHFDQVCPHDSVSARESFTRRVSLGTPQTFEQHVKRGLLACVPSSFFLSPGARPASLHSNGPGWTSRVVLETFSHGALGKLFFPLISLQFLLP